MKLYSTNNHKHVVGLKTAVLKGLPDDKGLYMPCTINPLGKSFFNQLAELSLTEIAFRVSLNLFDGFIPENDLQEIIEKSITFPAPLVSFGPDLHILELFHGPSMAFKDFGARYMAQLMGYFNKDANKELTILVATSGDTGGAVAAGFYDTPGINVVILYPSGKVSAIQEKQLTTLSKNIRALEVEGTFDDCQRLVKMAFLDSELNKVKRLSSANSINIARLIPQSFYYFEAYKQLKDITKPLVFSVPSGNFGNLTAGMFAHLMGLPVHKFLAATNANDIIPAYLDTGEYIPRPSERTISNAMDVGDPSNYKRLADIFKGQGSTWNNMKEKLHGFRYNDQATKEGILDVYQKYKYIIDPHGAIAYMALQQYQKMFNVNGIILETAHPAKFKMSMDDVLSFDIPVPEKLQSLAPLKKQATLLKNDFECFKDWLLTQH